LNGDPVINARPLRFVTVGYDDVLARPLLNELATEYARRYGASREEIHAQLRAYPAMELAPPSGGMLIGLLGERPVTGGGYRRVDACTAELKRVWTDNQFRRLGYAKELLGRLESEVITRGYRRLRLETGNRQPEAEALYLSAGYTRLSLHKPEGAVLYPITFVKTLW
jgi:GNAT superfamily N-acetyltransferase